MLLCIMRQEDYADNTCINIVSVCISKPCPVQLHMHEVSLSTLLTSTQPANIQDDTECSKHTSCLHAQHLFMR